MSMDRGTLKHLLALREVNKALIDGLKVAVFVLRNENNLSEKRRESLIESLERLIAQSEEVYEGALERFEVRTRTFLFLLIKTLAVSKCEFFG
jgi:hypothetical protein